MRDNPSARAHERVGARVRRFAPIVVALLTIAAVAGLTQHLGDLNLRSAERDRVADRVQIVAKFMKAGAPMYRASTIEAQVAKTPFSRSATATNAAYLQSFAVSAAGDRNLMVVLFDPTGHPLVSRPAGATLPVVTLGRAWTTALAGHSRLSPVFLVDGKHAWARVVPVGGATPWAVLVTVENLDEGWLQRLYQGLGSLGSGAGGLDVLDEHGVVAASWNPSELGTRPVATAQLATRSTRPRVWETGTGSARSIRIAVKSGSLEMPTTVMFEQRLTNLFGDLRRAQRSRDRSLLLIVAGCSIVLLLLSIRRHVAVRRSETRLRSLLRNTRDIVAVVGDRGDVRFVSPAIEHLLEREVSHCLGRPLADLAPRADRQRWLTELERCRTDGEATLLGVRLQRADDEAVWFDVVIEDLRGHPEVRGLLLTCHEAGERKDLEDALAYRAGHDPLTGLANRARFNAALEAIAAGDEGFALLCLDLDRFKPVNDRFGHGVGDDALKAVAGSLRGVVRHGDVVYRLGGDEFAIVAPGLGEHDASALAERLIAAIRSVSLDGSASVIGLDASVGVALAPAAVDAPNEVARDADIAMYRAKQAGGGRHVVVHSTAQPLLDGGDERGLLIAAPRPVQDGSSADSDADGAHWRERRVTGDGAPARARAASRRHPVRAARRLIPLVIAIAAVVAVAGIGFHQAGQAQSDAEAHRRAERIELVSNVARTAMTMGDPTRLIPVVAEAPWSFDGGGLTPSILGLLASSPALGDNTLAALLDRDGRQLASYPLHTTLAPDVGRDWQRVLSGEAITSFIYERDGLPRFDWVIPVTQGGRVRAVLVLGISLRDAGWAPMLGILGSLGSGPGGISTVDGQGRASASWSAAAIGRQVIDPARLPAAARSGARLVPDRRGSITIAAQFPSGIRYFAVLQERTTQFYSDLRRGVQARLLMLLGLVVFCVVGMMLSNRLRERNIRRSERRLDALLQHAHDLILVVAPDETVQFASSAIEDLLGSTPDRVVGHGLAELVAPGSLDAVRDAMARSPRHGGSVLDIRLLADDGSQRFFDVDVVDGRDQREIKGMLLTCHEIGDRKRLQDDLQNQATRDTLTGVANRSLFDDRLDALAGSSDTLGQFAIVFVDLDHFKPINDQLGHAVGDEVLRVVGARLTAAARPTDTVCRIGGDEFAVLVTDADAGVARGMADRILAVIREPLDVGGTTLHPDASVGVAVSSSDLVHPEQLMRRADYAMYRAKAAGRGRVVATAR